jgi:hypothetical protein
VRLLVKEYSVKHFTYLFTFFAFTSIVVLCLANFSLLFLYFFLQLEAAMKPLQKRKEFTSLQQWSLPSRVSQGCCLLPGLQYQEPLSLLTWMLSFGSLIARHSVPVMPSTFGPLMIGRLTLKSSKCRKGGFGS